MSVTEAMERQYGVEWRAGPPRGQQAVEAFELEHGVVLPEPYRSFVAHDADGAVGPPAYGLVGLGSPSDITLGHTITPGSLARPFPLTEHWIWEDEEQPAHDRLETVHRDGILPLGTDGDGMDYVLVVCGTSRGQVWLITDVGALPVAQDFGHWVDGTLISGAEWTLDNRRAIA